jgi:hypothetical protein
MEGGRVAEEAFRHVSGAMSAAVADLDDVPRKSRGLPAAREGLRGRMTLLGRLYRVPASCSCFTHDTGV